MADERQTKKSLMALVLAGGRFSDKDAAVAGTSIRALAKVGGTPLIARLLAAVDQVPSIERALVVGPQDLEPLASDDGAGWHIEGSTILDNLQAGIRAVWISKTKQPVLILGGDLAAPKSSSLADFIERSPYSGTVATVPLISRTSFEGAFPGSPSKFVRLKEGEFTIGSQFIAPAGIFLNPPPALSKMIDARKSQLEMAKILGMKFLLGLITGQLSIVELERRISDMIGCRAVAVRNCSPDLAFDIDDAKDLEYARTHVPRSNKVAKVAH